MCLAVPGKILSVHGEDFARTARVSFGGIVKEVCLAYTPDVQPGDYVLVHVGFAISKLDEQHALDVFEMLKRMGDLEGLDVPERGQTP